MKTHTHGQYRECTSISNHTHWFNIKPEIVCVHQPVDSLQKIHRRSFPCEDVDQSRAFWRTCWSQWVCATCRQWTDGKRTAYSTISHNWNNTHIVHINHNNTLIKWTDLIDISMFRFWPGRQGPAGPPRPVSHRSAGCRQPTGGARLYEGDVGILMEIERKRYWQAGRKMGGLFVIGELWWKCVCSSLIGALIMRIKKLMFNPCWLWHLRWLSILWGTFLLLTAPLCCFPSSSGPHC